MSNSDTLIGIVQAAPAQNTAILLPEAGVRVTYRSLSDQISEMADGLASMGIGRGDRVATFLPNGLPAVTSFLAASVAGTAAPLNPGYREEEVLFYLEDTSAKVLLLAAGDTSAGAEGARKAAAERGVPVFDLEMDASGYVRIQNAPGGKSAVTPSGDDAALILHTSGSTGRPKRVPIINRNLAASTRNIADHYSLTGDDVSL